MTSSVPDPTSKPVEIVLHRYSPEKLAELMLDYSLASRESIAHKRQYTYLAEYLSQLGAKTILVEGDYVDRDYLEDFSSYYVKCFKKYTWKCTRLHFLNEHISTNEFDILLQGLTGKLSHKSLERAYLGFVVIKPLPNTIIGRTCLRPPPSDDESRFPILHTQRANLFGFDLEIKTLPFQEQDSVVAACATSALWSAFQFTGRIFQHRIPTPVEITKLATQNGSSHTRHFPTKGLTPEEIARAIRSVGLEPHYVEASNPYVFMSTLYAYLRGRIPVFMSMTLMDPPTIQERDYKQRGTGTHGVLVHGVLVTGYRLGSEQHIFIQEESENSHEDSGNNQRAGGIGNIQLEAYRISELYVHDDQVGPFCKLSTPWRPIHGLEFRPRYGLRTAWLPEDDLENNSSETMKKPRVEDYARGVPEMLMMPLYYNIRIPYETIERIIRELDALLNEDSEDAEAQDNKRTRIVWDIYLTQGIDAKSSIISEGRLLGRNRSEFLRKPLPRFVWRTSAFQQGQILFDIVFDATDIHHGHLEAHFVEYDAREFPQIAHKKLSEPIQFKHPQTKHLIHLIANCRLRTGKHAAVPIITD